MTENKPNSPEENSISVRIGRSVYDEVEDYREELRRKKKPRPTRGALLEEAWRIYSSAVKHSDVPISDNKKIAPSGHRITIAATPHHNSELIDLIADTNLSKDQVVAVKTLLHVFSNCPEIHRPFLQFVVRQLLVISAQIDPSRETPL